MRLVCLRIGLVLGTEGGFITRMLTPFEFGLGGPLGSGRQWMSWIERDDLVRLIAYVIARSDIHGPINATAPIPVTNSKFTEELARRLNRPAIFRIPAALLRGVGGDFAEELLLGGVVRRVEVSRRRARGGENHNGQSFSQRAEHRLM